MTDYTIFGFIGVVIILFVLWLCLWLCYQLDVIRQQLNQLREDVLMDERFVE